MPIFEEERIMDLPVEGQNQPTPALGSPAYRPYPSPPPLPSSGVSFGAVSENDKSRRGLNNDQLSAIAKMPSRDTGPNLIPLSEVAANKRYNTYVRGLDLENIYGLQQSWTDQLANGVAKMAGFAAGTFAQSFATIPNTITALKTGVTRGAREGFAELSGSPDGYEAKIDNWYKNLEDYFPNYVTRRERENPFLTIIPFMPGSANFWGDKFIKNLGFMAGAIAGSLAQDAIVGSVTGGVGAAPILAGQIGKMSLWLNKILSGTNKIDAALDLGKGVGATTQAILNAKKLGEAAEGIRLLDGVRYGTAIFGASRTESAVESRDSYRVLKDELTKQYIRDNGREPEGKDLLEIERYAVDGMNVRFGTNLALLTASNAIQFGNLFRSFTTSSRNFANTITKNVDDIGDVRLQKGSLDVFEKLAPETKAGRLWESVRPTVKNIFTEGVYEEGGQFATEKGVYDYFTRKYKNFSNPDNVDNWNTSNETVTSALKGMQEQFGSVEGYENMIIGALTAVLTGKAQQKLGIVPKADERLQSTVNILNNYGLTGIFSQQFDNVTNSMGIVKEMENAVRENNVFKYNNLKEDMFFNFVTSRLPIGMHDVTIEQLRMLKNLDKAEFEKTFGTDFNASSKKTVNEYVDALITKANKIKEISDSLDNTFQNPFKFSINPQTPEDGIQNNKYQDFQDWKKDLLVYAYAVPAIDDRLASINQSIAAINPMLSLDALSRVTNSTSLREMADEYETSAASLLKGISDITPIAIARETRAKARALRTMSEKINLALNNKTANDLTFFNDVLNFELNNQDPKASKVIGPEKNVELYTYGVDINLHKEMRDNARKSFESLSSEKGFDKYMAEAEEIKRAPTEEEEKEVKEIADQSVFQYENKQGVKEPLELEREYEIPPFKKATIRKLADDRYEVTTPDGNKTFYSSREDADIATDEFNEQFKGLEKVKVVALNPDGSVKIQDAKGDIYNISIDKLKGYQKIESEQEKLQKLKEQVDLQQKEAEDESSTVATTEQPVDMRVSSDLLSDEYGGDPKDKRKFLAWLFWSTTAPSEDRSEDIRKPHVARAIHFLNNARKFKNRSKIRIMLVTPKQEEFLGVKGLTKLSTGQDPKTQDGKVVIDNLETDPIFAVYIEQDGVNRYFVDQDGNRIGKVGEQVDMAKVVFNTMPDTSLFWKEGGKNTERYRQGQKEQAEAMSRIWLKKREQLFNVPADNPEIYAFGISRGIFNIADFLQRNSIEEVFVDEKLIKNQEGLIVVSKTGVISHQGINYKVPVGQFRIQHDDLFGPAVNNLFNRQQAEAIYGVLEALSNDVKRQMANGEKIVFNPDYRRFLTHLLYWKKSPQTKKPNQIHIDEKMNLSLGDKKYDLTKVFDFKKEIVDQLATAYHNINDKSLSPAVEGAPSKFREPFIEFYIENGKLESRKWPNYQSYLLSSKYPDGKARNVDAIPVTTYVNVSTPEAPNTRQKYAILEQIEAMQLPVIKKEVVTEKPPVTKEGGVKVGGYELNSGVVNTYPFKKGKVKFTGTINPETNTTSIEIAIDDEETLATINKIADDSDIMASAIPVYQKENDVIIDKTNRQEVLQAAIWFAGNRISIELNQKLKEKPAAPVKEQAPVSVTPVTIGGVQFIPDDKTVYTSTQVFAEKDGDKKPVQFRLTRNEEGNIVAKVYTEDQTGNALLQKASDDDSLTAMRGFLPKVIKDYTPSAEPIEDAALFAAYKVTAVLQQQMEEDKKSAPTKAAVLQPNVSPLAQAQGTARTEPVVTATPVSDIEAKKADIERRRQEELDRLKNLKIGDEVTYLSESANEEFIDIPISNVKEAIKKLFRVGDYVKAKVISVKDSEVLLEGNISTAPGGLWNLSTIELFTNAKYDAELAALEGKPAEAPPAKEEPPAPKKKKPGKLPGAPEMRAVGVKEKGRLDRITDNDIEIFKEYHAKVASKLPYEIAERIFIMHNGDRAWGVFENGVAKFYRRATRGTEYHELFEGIWNAFLTEEERTAILDELKTKAGTFTDRASGKKIRYDEATDKELKERIADDFADYRVGKLPARTLGEKIVRFFRAIIEFFKSFVSKPSRKDELFKAIDKGKFKDYVVPEVVKGQAPEYKAIEGLTEQQTREYVEDITSRIFSYLFETNRSLYQIGDITDVDLYKYVKNLYQQEEKIDDTDPDYLSTKQFDELFVRTKQFLRTFKIEFDDENVKSINNEDVDNRMYAPEPFETDWKKQSPYAIKVLLGTNVKMFSQETPDHSSVGGFKLVNFGQMFAMTLDKLSNTSSVSKMLSTLYDIAKSNVNYVRFVKRLKISTVDGTVNFSEFKPEDWRLFIQFYQTFAAKQKPVALVQYEKGGQVYTAPANLFTAIKEKKDDWVGNMRVMSKLPDSIIKYNASTKTYQVADVKKIPIGTPEEQVNFLQSIGIDFPLTSYLKLRSTKEPDEKQSPKQAFGTYVGRIHRFIGENKDIVSVTGETLKVDSAIDRLAELYLSVENPAQDTTRFNLQGKRVVEYAENNYSSVFENEFNESATVDELLEKRPELKDVFSANSLVLKKGGLFFNDDGERTGRMKVYVIEGNKSISSLSGRNDAKLTAMLSPGARKVTEFNQNLNGRYYILIPADASTEWMLSMGNNVSYTEVVSGRAWSEVYDIFKGYLIDEFNLAKSDRSYLRNTKPRAKELRFFNEILSPDLLQKANALIDSDATSDEINAFIDSNKEKINESIKSFIETTTERTKEDLMAASQIQPVQENYSFSKLDNDFLQNMEDKVNKENLTEKELNDILTFANINYVIANIEMHKVIFGDPYQFKIKDNLLDETKRIKSYLSPRRTTFDTPEINNILNVERNLAGDIPLTENDPGHHAYKSYVKTSVFADVNIVGQLFPATNETDAFSILMDTTWREVKEKNGQLTEEGEKFFQWHMAYTRNRLAKKGVYQYTNDRLRQQDEKMIQKPIPKYMLEELKPIVTGNKEGRNYSDKVIDKMSQMPLFYHMAEKRNLEDLYIKMWKEKVGYIVYESGRKEGIEEKTHNVYNPNGTFNTEPFNNFANIPWKAYGIQVETSYDDFKDELTRGSQPTKMVSMDLFSNGEAVSETAKAEYKRNVRILNDIHRNGYEELLIKMGLKDLGNAYEIVDRVALSKSLEYEILRRNFSENVVDTVQLDENQQFRIPFEASNSYQEIRTIIFSMINKALVSVKTHGGGYVQVPVTGWESLGSSRSLVIKKKDAKGKFTYERISISAYEALSKEEQKNVYLSDDTLKMPTKEDPFMEVMLPHWFREKLPKKYDTDEKILNYLNSTEEGQSLLKGFGFRIPTQASSSMSAIRIKGFLPQYMGYTVVVPSEITTLAGSDFDIDKLFIYLKSFYLDQNGDIRLAKYYNSEEETKHFYAEVYENTLQKDIDKLEKYEEFRERLLDIFGKTQSLADLSLENLETLSDEDFEFYVKHKNLIDEIVVQAEEEEMAPIDYLKEQIKRLGGKKEKLTAKQLNEQLKDRYVRKMYRRALENEYYDSMIKLATLPENYDRMIVPVDDGGLKDVANEIDDLRGDSELDEQGKPKVKNRLLDRTYMSTLRHSFIAAKKWVGIAATNITALSIFQKSKIYLDPARLPNINRTEREILGDMNVALPHNTVMVNGKPYVSLSGSITADGTGRYISSRLSGYATSFVDVANDPFIMRIIRSELLVGTFMFLERIGSGEFVPFFLNQPIITEYIKMLESSNKRWLFGKQDIELIREMFPTSDTVMGETTLNVGLDALKDNIRKYYKEKSFTEVDNAQQNLILDEFLKYAMMASHSFKMTQATNYDTSKMRSGDLLFRKQTRTANARKNNIICCVDEILNSTQLGVQAMYIDKSTAAAGEYLQLEKPEIREQTIDLILRQYAENDFLDEERFSKIGMRLTSSLIDYVIQTRTGINSDIRQIFVDEGTSAASLVRKAMEQNPDHPLLKHLSIRPSRIEGGVNIVKLQGNTKEFGLDENYFIGLMRELRDTPETNDVYKALVKMAVLQGSQQTATSIKNIVPLEDYSKELKDKVTNIRYTPDMEVFIKDMFYRNQWKNEDVFRKVYPKFFIRTDRYGNPEMSYTDPDTGEPIYYYNSPSFPVLKTLGVNRNSNLLLILNSKYHAMDVQSEYLLVDRLLKKPDNRVKDKDDNPYIDIVTGRDFSDSEFRKLIVKGNPIATQVFGYKKVKNLDGTPVIIYDKEGERKYVYKLINLYGEGDLLPEYYTDLRESAVNNNTAKIENEIDDTLIYEYVNGINSKKQQNVKADTTYDTMVFEKPIVSTTSTSIQRPYPGVENIPNTNLSIEQSNEFIDLLQPQIANQAYVENRAKTANRMFSFGLRWAKQVPNESETSKQNIHKGTKRPNQVPIRSKSDYTYGYYSTDQNNNALPPLSQLQPIVDFIESKLGIDMSQYDSMLGNIYENNSFIHQHRDVTESASAKNYPVIVINIGADGGLIYDLNTSDKDINSKAAYDAFQQSIDSKSMNIATLPLKNGGIYAFGVNGINRFTFNHRIVDSIGQTVTKPIKVPVWDAQGNKMGEKTLTNYRITLTFRRAQDLTADVAETPRRLETVAPVEAPAAPVTPVTEPSVEAEETVPTYYEITGEKPPLTYDEKIQKLNTIKGNMMIDFYGKFRTHTSVRNISEEFYQNITNNFDPFYVELREWIFNYRKTMLGLPIEGDLDMDSSEIIEKYTLHLQGKSFDKYLYYGAYYEILVDENGKGIDVIGYKGKEANKQKLLEEYNKNPNIDAQSGKPFRNVVEETVKKQEAEYKGERFTFKDGNQIQIPFKLNAEQEAALYKLEEYIKNPKQFDNQVTLVGYAGTGKTTIISLFDKYLKKKYIKPVYTSPTHRANAVTKQKNPSAKVVTLHSLFGLGPNIKLEDGDYTIKDLEFAQQNKPKIQGGQTLIVDEASMVSEALYKFLESFKKALDINIIYVGDPAQLKPVKDKGISPVFSKGEQTVLTKVERTGDNPILRESTNLRNGQDFAYYTDIAPSGGVEYVNNVNRANQVIAENFNSEEFKNNPLYFRILSGTNAKVEEYNNLVRDLLFDTREQLVEGDILMGYNNFDVDYATQEPVIVNSGDYQVIRVEKGKRKIDIEGQTLEFSGYSVALSNLMNPSDAPKQVFVVDNNESKEKIFKFVDAISAYNILGARAMSTGNRSLAASYFQQARSLESRLAFMRGLEDANGKLKVKKTLGYGYAHTIHKSQGGTYNRVMVLADTIDAFKDPETKQQLKYVAMSRASEMVYVSTNQPLKERPKGEFETTTEFTEEQKNTILSNFAAKHKMTMNDARRYINDGFANKPKEEVIAKLKECYL